MIRIVTSIALFLSAGAAFAEIEGHDDPAFDSALESWLAGDDRTALVDFSELANANVPAGQVFLGQIERQTWLHQHVTGPLDRRERIALLRNPQGLSGKTWLSSAAPDVPLAQLLLDSLDPAAGIALGQQLAEAGEIAHALDQIRRGLNATGDVLAAVELALHPDLAAFTSGFVQPKVSLFGDYVKAGTIDPTDIRITTIQNMLAAVPAIDPAGALMWGEVHISEVLELNADETRAYGVVLAADDRLAPLAALAGRLCPEDPTRTLAAIELSEPFWPDFILGFSPVPALLSAQDYQSSARFDSDVLRQLAFVDLRVSVIEQLDPCLFDHVIRARDN